MELLLSILLYLGVVATGSSYSTAEIDALAHHNQAQVDVIYQDPVLSDQILTENRDSIVGMVEPDQGEE